MSVEVTDIVEGPFTPNGVTTEFPFDFKIADTDEVRVFVLGDDGAETEVNSALYTVELAGDGEGGTVTFLSAPEVATYPNLYIISDPAFTSLYSATSETISIAALVTAIDRGAIRDLALKEKVDRGLKVQTGQTPPVIDVTGLTTGKVLAFDGDKMVPATNSAVEAELAADRAEDARDQSVAIASQVTSDKATTLTYKTAAELAAGEAEDSATDAETALASTITALGGANIYTDTTLAAAITAGLAAVADTEQFYATGDDVEYVGFYQDNAGTEVELARIAKPSAFDSLNPTGNLPGAEFAITDSSGNAALTVDKAGYLNTTMLTPCPTNGARLRGEIMLLLGSGQSLEVGGGVAQTTAQEYDCLRYILPTDPDPYASPEFFNEAYSQSGESPGLGAVGTIKRLLLEENGVTHTDHTYKTVMVSNGKGNQTIAQLGPGGASGKYEDGDDLIDTTLSLATNLGWTFKTVFESWTQGEANSGDTVQDYYDALVAYAEQRYTDIKASLGNDAFYRLIVYQTNSNTNARVAVAQWRAATEHPLIIMSTPTYFFDYLDNQHLLGPDYQWYGAYIGLAAKRTLIDGQEWQPLRPVDVSIVGDSIEVTLNHAPVVDTSIMPSVTNYGFTVTNDSDVSQTISSVSILPGNRLKIAMAATPSAGWHVQYANNNISKDSATIGQPYTGGAGNIRDNYGLFHTAYGNTLHRWLVAFDWEI